MQEIFSDNNQPELFQVEGQLTEEDVLFLEETSGVSTVRSATGEIVTPFRAKSYFSIGEPIVLPLAQLLHEHGEAVAPTIRLQTQDYDFYYIQLACSFQAAPGCRFHDARFALTLQTASANPQGVTGSISHKAIAYDLFPLRFEDERKVSVKYGFNPEIKFDFNPISSSLALPGLFERSEEYISYTSRVEAFDLQGTHPAWSFVRTASHELGGPQKLFMIVRKPKGTQVNATFNLAAHVQFIIGNIALDPAPLVMLFRRGSPLSVITDPTVPLC